MCRCSYNAVLFRAFAFALATQYCCGLRLADQRDGIPGGGGGMIFGRGPIMAVIVTQPGQRQSLKKWTKPRPEMWTGNNQSVVEDVAFLLTHHKCGTGLLKGIANILARTVGGSFGYLFRKDRACQHAVEEHGTVDTDAIQDLDADCGVTTWHAVHLMRDPWEVVLSGYHYHGHNFDPIPYLNGSGPRGNGHPSPNDYSHMSENEGLLYEATLQLQSTLADMVQTFKRSRKDKRILNLRMEDFETDFNGTLQKLYGHLVHSEEALIQTMIDSSQSLNTQTWSPKQIAPHGHDHHVMSHETRIRLRRVLCDLLAEGKPAILDELLILRNKLGYNEPAKCK